MSFRVRNKRSKSTCIMSQMCSCTGISIPMGIVDCIDIRCCKSSWNFLFTLWKVIRIPTLWWNMVRFSIYLTYNLSLSIVWGSIKPISEQSFLTFWKLEVLLFWFPVSTIGPICPVFWKFWCDWKLLVIPWRLPQGMNPRPRELNEENRDPFTWPCPRPLPRLF